MCRSIKTLHNFTPPATEAEIRASSLQFVRKLSGFSKPSKANEAAFARAVDEVAGAARALLDALVQPDRGLLVDAGLEAQERDAVRPGVVGEVLDQQLAVPAAAKLGPDVHALQLAILAAE